MRFDRGSGERKLVRRKIIGDVVIKRLSPNQLNKGGGVGEGCIQGEGIGLYIEIL
jgi:hypothetical protein